MKYAVATVAAIIILATFAFLGAGMGWQDGGGYLPQAVLWLSIFGVWRAITRRAPRPAREDQVRESSRIEHDASTASSKVAVSQQAARSRISQVLESPRHRLYLLVGIVLAGAMISCTVQEKMSKYGGYEGWQRYQEAKRRTWVYIRVGEYSGYKSYVHVDYTQNGQRLSARNYKQVAYLGTSIWLYERERSIVSGPWLGEGAPDGIIEGATEISVYKSNLVVNP